MSIHQQIAKLELQLANLRAPVVSLKVKPLAMKPPTKFIPKRPAKRPVLIATRDPRDLDQIERLKVIRDRNRREMDIERNQKEEEQARRAEARRVEAEARRLTLEAEIEAVSRELADLLERGEE